MFWSPHLTILAWLQAAPVDLLLTVGALETRWAVADVGRIRVCASHTQATIETRSVRTCHPTHLTLQPIKPTGTGTFEGSGRLLGRGKRRLDWVSSEQNPIPFLSLNPGGFSLSGLTSQHAGASPRKPSQDHPSLSLCFWSAHPPTGQRC